ncbi:MAG: hypothetical protein CL930_13785 [Deltaproteobacteria bacterium]|nr:hypothetical protein [Deltaproteobacteria bacterium]
MSVSLASIKTRMNKVGLGHIGVVTREMYDEVARPEHKAAVLAPASNSVLVLASVGRLLWDTFLKRVSISPELLTHSQHPLDDFVEQQVKDACTDLGLSGHTVFFADERARVHLDFRSLAVLSGVGAESRLGLVIHPEYGPWMGLRAAIFIQECFPASHSIAELCSVCESPCVPACPGGAMDSGQWSVGKCVDFHHRSTACSGSCAARTACIVGVESQYSEMEILYHSNRLDGRRVLRDHLGIDEELDHFEGQGPDWGIASDL